MTGTERDICGNGIITETFRMKKGRMLREVALRFMKIPIIVLMVMISGFSVLGAYSDLRWIVFALMLLFVATPLLLMWLYVRYCVTLEVAVNTVEHTLEVSAEGIKCRWCPTPSSPLLGEREQGAGSEIAGAADLPEWKETVILLSRIEKVKVGLDALTLWLRDGGKASGFIFIPYVVIPEGRGDELLEICRGIL